MKGILPRFDLIIMLAKALDWTADYLLRFDFDYFINTSYKQMDRLSIHDFINVIKALNKR